MSEIQQELVDINQRYDILGERLADRHQELRNILENMRSYLQNMQEFLTWIDLKELDLNVQGGLPTSEREAKKQLKEHQVWEPVFFLEGSKTQTELCRSLKKGETIKHVWLQDMIFLQEFHAELLGKENLATDIRTKGQELLKTKQGVPGLDICQQQLAELGMSGFLIFLIPKFP